MISERIFAEKRFFDTFSGKTVVVQNCLSKTLLSVQTTFNAECFLRKKIVYKASFVLVQGSFWQSAFSG